MVGRALVGLNAYGGKGFGRSNCIWLEGPWIGLTACGGKGFGRSNYLWWKRLW